MYKQHCANLKRIDFSIIELENSIKFAIKTKNDTALGLHTNIHTFLTGAWIEVSLYKLINEHQFTDNDRTLILTKNNIPLEDKWKNAINLAFSKAFSVDFNKIDLDPKNIGPKLSRTQQYWYQDLLNFIQNDIKQVVLLRNKIAHGQWHFTFNNNVTELNTDIQKEIHSNHYFKSKLRLETIKIIIEMIRNIAISPKTFKRDFDELYTKIEHIKIRYNDRSYKRNISNIQDKYGRAEYWKQRNLS